MPMNKQSGDMYSWVSHTWNPIRGTCPHKCVYCYLKRLPNRGILRLVPKELKEDLGAGNYVFLGSATDMFADLVPSDWILQVLEYCKRFDKNQYLFQTKNPGRFYEFINKFPKQTTLGTTIETNHYPVLPSKSGTLEMFPIRQEDFLKISDAPGPIHRASAMELVSKAGSKYGLSIMVTIEPIMKFDLDAMVKWIKMIAPDWINIGADSKGHHLPEPSWAKILKLIEALSEFTEVRKKPNLTRIRKATGLLGGLLKPA